MVNFKKWKYFILILLLLGLLLVGIVISRDKPITKCNMKYALCPAAKCTPYPYDNSKAYCFCDVQIGTNYSVGNDNCDNIQPFHTSSGEFIYSDYNPIIEKMGYHVQPCAPEEVNLNCMNKICKVDPNDPTKAVCVCDKTDNKGISWFTYNKNGEPKTCNYQSGANFDQHKKVMAFIKQNAST